MVSRENDAGVIVCRKIMSSVSTMTRAISDLSANSPSLLPTFAVLIVVSLCPTSIVTMKVAIEGCCHGMLDAIYSYVAHLGKKNGYKVDILLIGGDFQAIRNERDLQCMAVPDKYRKLGEFYK